MQNENLENQASPIRRNPSRNNTNVNQGQGHDKQHFNEEAEKSRTNETVPSKHDRSESDVDGGGVSDSTRDSGHQFGGGEAVLEKGFSGNQQAGQVPSGSPNSGSQIQKSVSGDANQAGAGAGYGSQNKNADSGTGPRGQDSGKFNQSQDDSKH